MSSTFHVMVYKIRLMYVKHDKNYEIDNTGETQWISLIAHPLAIRAWWSSDSLLPSLTLIALEPRFTR